jgi:exonuclease VII large subunit
MGAGTNVQDRIVALHHLDCPWKPRDIEQQEGRAVRQGNTNKKVKIYRYVTEGTFDAYNWSLIENKQKFIGQVMTSKSPVRSAEDIDETALSYAEVKALATGDPRIKEKMDLDIQVAKLKLLKSNYQSQMYRMEDNLIKYFPQQIQKSKETIEGLKEDLQFLSEHRLLKDEFLMTIEDKVYSEKKDAGYALISACKQAKEPNVKLDIGKYRGLQMSLTFDKFSRQVRLNLKNELSYSVDLGSDVYGNLTRINNLLDTLPQRLKNEKEHLSNLEQQMASAKVEVEKPFLQDSELKEKTERLTQLNYELSNDNHNENLPEQDGVDKEEIYKDTLELEEDINDMSFDI